MARRPAHPGDRQIDWTNSLRFFRDTLARLVARGDADLVDSLASDAALRLVRVARRETIRNPEAMMTTIAYRVYQDWKRKIATEPSLVSIDAPDDDDGDALDVPDRRRSLPPIDVELASNAWLTFKALELIREVAGEACRDYLKAYYLEDTDHPEIAARLDIAPAAARKRKSRCEAVLAAWIQSHPGHRLARELRGFLDRYEDA